MRDEADVEAQPLLDHPKPTCCRPIPMTVTALAFLGMVGLVIWLTWPQEDVKPAQQVEPPRWLQSAPAGELDESLWTADMLRCRDDALENYSQGAWASAAGESMTPEDSRYLRNASFFCSVAWEGSETRGGEE